MPIRGPMASLRTITVAAVCAVLTLGLAPASRANADSPPPHFRLSASQAQRIAEHSHAGKRPVAGPGTRWTARTAGPGRWWVTLRRGQKKLFLVMIEDRTGEVLEGGSADWAAVPKEVQPLGQRVEIAFLVLAVAFLAP